MFSLRWCFQLALAAICFNVLFHQVSALTIEYCSSLNTASTAKNSSIYQSNGLCHDFCVANYAFAIVQDDGCWCSDYAPGTTTTGCDNECPGFPSDLCGGNGLYGYIALVVAVSGTEGASTTAPSSSSSSAAAQSTTTPSTTPPITTSSKPQSTSSTWTPTPVISLETVTGQIRTVTVTPTVPPTSGSAVGVTQNKSGSSLGTGAAVGLTIGLVALVAIITAIVYFCVKTRRKEKAAEYNDMSRRGSSAGLGSPGGIAPSRTMSQNSRFVLNTDGRQVVETWEPGEAPGARLSRLMPVDPRLDPFALVYQRGDNKSRESVNTIRDDQDYSRRVAGPAPILRATNPDGPDD